MKPGYTPVTSSQISAFAYDANNKKLNIVFVKNGDEYQYSNVDQGTVDQLTTAESFGSTFSRLIKKNPQTFPFQKV
jgi:hypothetical protein